MTHDVTKKTEIRQEKGVIINVINTKSPLIGRQNRHYDYMDVKHEIGAESKRTMKHSEKIQRHASQRGAMEDCQSNEEVTEVPSMIRGRRTHTIKQR